MARAPYTINFRFVGNAQTGKATRQANVQKSRDARGRFVKVQEMFNTIVEDVALNTADRTYSRAKASLESGLKSAISAEIAQMAKMIARYSVQPKTARGPSGVITSTQTGISDQARNLWGNKNVIYYELNQTDAAWGTRSKRYMAWKNEKGYPSDWWKMTGELRRELGKKSLYESLGPIKVNFLKTGRTLDSKPKQTASGRKGMVSKTYSVGQLNVEVMGRITPEMLPALMDRLGNGVNDATPHGSSKLIPSLFKDEDTRNKLLKFGADGYRPVVEPFLAYYLTRAIPNLVFKRTEKLISDQGGRFTTSNGRRDSTGMGGLY